MFMQRIKLQNILSFGPDAQELELAPLNVLIGPNGSGKSNLIEAIGMLRAVPKDLLSPIRDGGGGSTWIWRGDIQASEGRLEVTIDPTFSYSNKLLRYALAIDYVSFLEGMVINEEIVEAVKREDETVTSERYLERAHVSATVSYRNEGGVRNQRDFPPTEITLDQSMLAQLKDPVHYPELTFLGNELGKIHIYREWTFGRNTPPRLPQRADLPNHSLAEDGSNLGMVLNRLKRDPKAKNQFMNALKKLYDGVEDFDVIVEVGTVQVFLQEGNVTMPATRLSDGTLRYLCLLAILCHPSPPPLVCLEEPELGLHPDVIPGLAELLREASRRCQLIVTTHSDTLVDALTDTPESVVVCQKENGQTRMKRLDKQELAGWLEKYSLGDYWMRGGLGGTRW